MGGLRRRADEPGLVGDDHELGAVARAKLEHRAGLPGWVCVPEL